MVDRVRIILHTWEKYGEAATQQRYKEHKKKELQIYRAGHFTDYTYGLLNYIKMIKGRDDPLYTRLAKKFNKLSQRDNFIFRQLAVGNTARLLHHLKHAVFIIEADDNVYAAQGTAFNIDGLGFITCDHVRWIEGDHSTCFFDINIAIIDLDDKFISEVKLIKNDAEKDFAIFQATEKYAEVMGLKISENKPKQGEVVYLVGYPYPHTPGQDLSIFETTVVSPVYTRVGVHLFDVAQQIRVGNSGGPVLNKDFEVIGIAREGAEQSGGRNGVLWIGDIFN
jgi:hypothetical protein